MSIYLNDHLAGAVSAIDLVEYLIQEYPNQELGRFARRLKVQLVSDKQVVEKLLDFTGGPPSPFKKMLAWLSSRLSRLKFGSRHGLGSFEALEMLRIGIFGKIGLWEALQVSLDESKLSFACDFNRLITDAEAQLVAVEVERLKILKQVFGRKRLAA